jgi:hypothetical protein
MSTVVVPMLMLVIVAQLISLLHVNSTTGHSGVGIPLLVVVVWSAITQLPSWFRIGQSALTVHPQAAWGDILRGAM